MNQFDAERSPCTLAPHSSALIIQ